MGAVYKSICNEADTLLLHSTRLSEKIVELKVNIEKLMNDGFVNIAKARYIMGSTCVTKMQLPTENSNPIKALATVHRMEENNNCIFYITRVKQSKSNVSNSEGSEGHIEVYGECNSTNISEESLSNVGKSVAAFRYTLQNNPKSLKKTKNAFLVEDDLYQEFNDELLDEMSNSESNESLVSVTDPIRLFGILVPNALKEAQVVFNDVVNLLGDCATVEFELKETLEKLSHLYKVKNLIETASKQMKLDILTPRVYWTPSESSSVSCYLSEPEEENEELSKVSSLTVQKSIRSVFYEKDAETQEREFSLWGSTLTLNSEHENLDN